jgi:hypothetical protein
MGSVSTPASHSGTPSIQLIARPSIDPPVFQSKWMSLPVAATVKVLFHHFFFLFLLASMRFLDDSSQSRINMPPLLLRICLLRRQFKPWLPALLMDSPSSIRLHKRYLLLFPIPMIIVRILISECHDCTSAGFVFQIFLAGNHHHFGNWLVDCNDQVRAD